MKLNNIKRTFLASAALLSTISMSAADKFVDFKQGDLLLNANNRVEIYMDTNDCKGVSYAAHALLKDIKSVSGATATLTSDAGFLKKADTARPAILVGTIGHSAATGKVYHHAHRWSARHCWQRPPRHHLWHLRTLAADGRFTLVRLGRRAYRASRFHFRKQGNLYRW